MSPWSPLWHNSLDQSEDKDIQADSEEGVTVPLKRDPT